MAPPLCGILSLRSCQPPSITVRTPATIIPGGTLLMSRAVIAVLFAAAALPAQQQGGRGQPAASARLPVIEERIAGMQKLDGYFPLYWDDRTGNLYLEIPRLDTDFLYTTGLAAGLGSNDLGLDRGQQGAGKIVSLQRVGPRVLMVQGNESFRSSSPNP